MELEEKAWKMGGKDEGVTRAIVAEKAEEEPGKGKVWIEFERQRGLFSKNWF